MKKWFVANTSGVQSIMDNDVFEKMVSSQPYGIGAILNGYLSVTNKRVRNGETIECAAHYLSFDTEGDDQDKIVARAMKFGLFLISDAIRREGVFKPRDPDSTMAPAADKSVVATKVAKKRPTKRNTKTVTAPKGDEDGGSREGEDSNLDI